MYKINDMNKSILIGVIGFFLLIGIVVIIWNCGNSESYWPQTDYTYVYVYNGKESKKSPILSLGPKNDKSKNPEFTLEPLGNYTINMYRRVEGKDWELLGNIPAGQTSYKDTTPPPPPSPSPSGYVFNYDKTDNHLGIKVDKTKDNYFFILGDWGAGPTGCETVQKAVADKMLDYYNNNKDNKNLLFVLTVGDNFYWTGLDQGDMFKNTWSNIYKDLCYYKWLSCMGNHDWGDNDSYCVCPSNNPYKEINGQKYQCNQLNADKGGYRPTGTENYYLPDFGYHYTINDLDLEIIVTSQTGDGHSESTGGDSSGRSNVEKNCGGGDNMTNKLTAISNSGKDLITSRARETQTNNVKNVIIAQHYDDLDDSMYSLFTSINKSAKVISAAGHVHNTYCAKQDGNLCTHVISGGGGGCCLAHPACTAKGEVGSGAGFFVVNIDTSKNMTTEQIMVGGQ